MFKVSKGYPVETSRESCQIQNADDFSIKTCRSFKLELSEGESVDPQVDIGSMKTRMSVSARALLLHMCASVIEIKERAVRRKLHQVPLSPVPLGPPTVTFGYTENVDKNVFKEIKRSASVTQWTKMRSCQYQKVECLEKKFEKHLEGKRRPRIAMLLETYFVID